MEFLSGDGTCFLPLLVPFQFLFCYLDGPIVVATSMALKTLNNDCCYILSVTILTNTFIKRLRQ